MKAIVIFAIIALGLVAATYSHEREHTYENSYRIPSSLHQYLRERLASEIKRRHENTQHGRPHPHHGGEHHHGEHPHHGGHNHHERPHPHHGGHHHGEHPHHGGHHHHERPHPHHGGHSTVKK